MPSFCILDLSVVEGISRNDDALFGPETFPLQNLSTLMI